MNLRRLLDKLPHDTLYIAGEPYMHRWYIAGYAPAPKCGTCDGDGRDPDGEGWYYQGHLEPGSVPPCPTCHGHGVIGNEIPGHRPTRKGWWWNWGIGAVRLHQIVASDDSRAFHDHPWPFLSIGLTGSYTEVRPASLTYFTDGFGNRQIASCPAPNDVAVTRRRYRAPFVNLKKATDLHLLMVEDGPVWSLFISGRKARKWGFAGPFGWLNYVEFDERFPERNAFTEQT